MPLISVIVPVYKVEPYLRRCVDSILAQTFEDFELILVDDGSPDNCGTICDEYEALDPRVHVIHQQNGGLSAARNSGIEWALANSKSEWLSFVDSDDWVHPRFLEYLYRAAKENGVGISVCGFERTESQTEHTGQEYSSSVLVWDKFYINDPVAGAIAVNKLYRKELFANKCYPVGRLHEDEFLTYKLLYAAGTVAFVPLELYYYYQNPEGIMKSEFSLKRLDAIDALKEQCKFANDIGHKGLYLSRIKGLIFCCATDVMKLKEIKNGKTEVRRATRELRGCLRRLLLRFGKELVPVEQHRWCYEAAFPHFYRLYWACIGITQKMKRMVK